MLVFCSFESIQHKVKVFQQYRIAMLTSISALDPKSERTLIRLTKWVRSLVLVASEANTLDDGRVCCGTRNAPHDLTTRMAAVLSIGNFFKSLRNASSTLNSSPELLAIYLTLHDTMIDDDEDVRAEGAHIVSSLILSLSSEENTGHYDVSLSPPAAKHRLLAFLIAEYNKSERLWAEGLVRISGYLPCAYIEPRLGLFGDHNWKAVRHFGQLLESHEFRKDYDKLVREQTKNAVFEVEKQNLYVDSVLEIDTWVDVVRQMQSEGDCSQAEDQFRAGRVSDSMCIWATNSLYSLCQVMLIDKDIIPVLSSKAEVFTLVYKVVAIAGYCHYLWKMDSSKQRPSDWQTIRNLQAYLKAARNIGENATRLHPVLLTKMDEVIIGFSEEPTSQ